MATRTHTHSLLPQHHARFHTAPRQEGARDFIGFHPFAPKSPAPLLSLPPLSPSSLPLLQHDRSLHALLSAAFGNHIHFDRTLTATNSKSPPFDESTHAQIFSFCEGQRHNRFSKLQCVCLNFKFCLCSARGSSKGVWFVCCNAQSLIFRPCVALLHGGSHEGEVKARRWMVTGVGTRSDAFPCMRVFCFLFGPPAHPERGCVRPVRAGREKTEDRCEERRALFLCGLPDAKSDVRDAGIGVVM